MGFLRTKTKIKIRQASSLMVVPPKKAAVKYSWLFCLTSSIPVTTKNVRPDMNEKTTQKLSAKNAVLPVYCSNTGGMAIIIINNRKESIDVEIFIDNI